MVVNPRHDEAETLGVVRVDVGLVASLRGFRIEVAQLRRHLSQRAPSALARGYEMNAPARDRPAGLPDELAVGYVTFRGHPRALAALSSDVLSEVQELRQPVGKLRVPEGVEAGGPGLLR